MIGVAAALPADAADRVQVRGAEHEGYARIAVEWPDPVAFDAKLEGDTLTIHFARGFTASLNPLPQLLDHYLTSVGQSADGSSIIAKLKKPVTIKTATVNRTIAAIDLVARPPAAREAAKAAPPPKVEAAEAKPVAAQNPEPTNLITENSGGQVPAPVAADPSGAPVNLLLASAFTTVATAGTTEASVAPAAATSKDQPSAAAPKAEPEKVEKVEKVEVRGAEHKGFARIAVEWPNKIGFETKLDGDTLTIHFARPFTAPLTSLVKDLDHYVAQISQSADGTAIIVKLKQPVELRTATVNGKIASIDLVGHPAASAEKPAPKSPAVKRAEARRSEAKKAEREKAKPRETEKAPAHNNPPAAAAAPKNVTPPALSAAAPPKPGPARAAALPASAPAVKGTEPGGTMTPVLTFDNDRASLRFDWANPTGAAIYRRGAATWVVFSTPATLDLTAVRQRGLSVLRAADQIRVDGATALRLVTADGINPSVRRAGNSWVIDLKHQDAGTDTPIVIEPRPGNAVPSVELHVHDGAAPVRLRDPILADRLTIVPVGEVGRGVDATRDFVDFRLLPSTQGVVIRPNADDLDVQSDPDGIRITRRHGLVLSDVRDRLLGRAIANRRRIFDFAGWRGPANQSFIERRSILERAIALALPGARTRPRIDLAHYYFSYAFGPETMSVLAQIARDDPQTAAEPPLRALKGAACLLAGDDDCAALELGQHSLDGEPEAALWRASLAADQSDWQTASREFLRGANLLSTYPKSLRNRFALQGAEAMLEGDRAADAGPLLDIVLNDNPEMRDRAMALYLQGRIAQQAGQLDKALKLWDQVAAMDDRKARSRALYARTMALYEAKRASGVDTIKALDAMRFAWRGDNFEFTLLRRLGELKLAEHDPEGGLAALHLAVSYFPNNPATKDVAQEAVDRFTDLFIGKGADDMPPVKALALYDAFHDLDPSGERHDAIVKKLVDRLVSVDLLDRAATLLEDQVKTHLSGSDKARAATQLALLRLMNQQPDRAIAALDINVADGLTPDLTRQRQQLRARALLDLNRAPEAIAILSNDNSRDAYRLRADIYWRQHDWKNAAKIFATLAGQPPAQGALDPETAKLVLSWAAALTLDGDQQGLAKLRQDFGAAMAGTPGADAFKVIAGNGPDTGGGTPVDVANRVAQIGTLQNFMSAYKERLANTKLSAIN